MTKYKHTHTAFVESLNKFLADRLLKVHDAQELNDPDKLSATWVRYLYELVDELNDTETDMTGMKPKDAIELDLQSNERIIHQKRNYLRMGCISTYYNR